MALEPWRTGKVIKIEQQTNSTRRFFIQIPELERFDFKPGQFVTLDLPIHEKPNKRWRSYSIASWPDGTNIFELCIVLLEDGLGTNYLFNEIKEGSEIMLRGPVGVFTMPDPLEKDLFLICTGTGIAPFRSMLHHIKNHQIPYNNIYLLFGCRYKADILYYEELKKLSDSMLNVHYLPTLSRENWEGPTGYVHTVYENICNANKTANNGELVPANFYLCGWKNMIDEAKQRIQALGYDRKAIHQELYG
ncbi:MAG: FAD-dependent oxidoreductase [Chitinophagaceae bacterium]|nr:MAG: FAD-dependent oxidoreductase [Chitinophagaceae bacterium]